jgi:ABC-type lipoprotein export system ATPase subunit
MSLTSSIVLNAGSSWNRWDPHIHAPDTLLANQFTGKDPWEDFLDLIERSDPPIRALGITDYWSIGSYLKVKDLKKTGRLQKVALLFPNVEFRLDIHTEKTNGINLHLLFSPDDPNHVSQIERFLSRLEFTYLGQPYPCTRQGLINLGYSFNKLIVEDNAALEAGANQFKVSFAELQKRWNEDPWVRANCLVAVSGGSNDGTAGLSGDGSYQATRQEIERFAHIIFASQPKQRDFWLGRGLVTMQELEEKCGGLKPCLHGSDAHTQAKVGVPFEKRYSWIKGDLTFESLRQACIEPENRAIVAPVPPSGALPSNVITQVEITNASWLPQATVPLNAGIVAVIGARGSGKTALADLIAAGADAVSRTDERSFIRRARPHLSGSTAELTWQSGPKTYGDLDDFTDNDWASEPQVQYLSQQFVDQLCSAEGLDDSLLAEIERVIFDAHMNADRMGTHSFRELLSLRTEAAKLDRERAEGELGEIAAALAEERTRKASLQALATHKQEKEGTRAKTRSDRAALLGKGKASDAAQLELLREAVEAKRQSVGTLKQTQRAIQGLQADASEYRLRTLPSLLQKMKSGWYEAALTEVEWANFELDFKGDVSGVLTKKAAAINKLVSAQEGPPEQPSIVPNSGLTDLSVSHLPAGISVTEVPLRTLERELKRLTALVGVDEANARRLGALSEKLSREDGEIKAIEVQIERAKASDENIRVLQEQRTATYEALMGAIVQEEIELTSLYQPLAERLSGESGSLGKLSFYVKRDVDIKKWALQGEGLLDLRKVGDFRGKGSLLKAASDLLLKAWTTGTAAQAAQAMAVFREQYDDKFREYAPVERADKEEYLRWTQRIAEWLYSGDHISVSYDLQYDGVKIEQLSPGTRGIVLLLLYLAVDGEDTRPLIIDQPEENLDPQSVVTDLVSRFREARTRRQIIIVTHNANLVVNTDVDQVIVARSGAHRPGELPIIEYLSGGLEDPGIRKWVCDILEGGAKAFRERAKRLRISITV